MNSYTYTSVEQSKKLAELGLDPATADLSWNSKKLDDPEFELQIGYNPALKFKLFSFRSGHVIPCWSIGRLMELIPDHIMHDGVATVLNPDPKDRLHLRTAAYGSAPALGKCYNGTCAFPFSES